MAGASATVVIVPGLRDHVPDHWQTHLAARLPTSRSVSPLGREDLRCAARLTAIEQVIARIVGEIILVAHSGGAISVAHWARQSSRQIRGALLATPADFHTPLPAGYPTMGELDRNGWLPVPRDRLPFRSIVGASRNDPLCRYDTACELASNWGSEVVDLGEVGHLNPASGFGHWPGAEAFVAELAS